MSRLRTWIVRHWRWARNRCPACGDKLRSGIVGLAPASGCPCGFWASFMFDGSAVWNFPPPDQEDDGWIRDRIRSIRPARRSSREDGR